MIDRHPSSSADAITIVDNASGQKHAELAESKLAALETNFRA
jgi:hypothetical protein